MVTDKSAMIVNESVRRMIDECVECMENSREVTFDPIQGLVGPDRMKRLAAMNNVMMRIIQSVSWN